LKNYEWKGGGLADSAPAIILQVESSSRWGLILWPENEPDHQAQWKAEHDEQANEQWGLSSASGIPRSPAREKPEQQKRYGKRNHVYEVFHNAPLYTRKFLIRIVGRPRLLIGRLFLADFWSSKI
jgi:hypothetical protein